VALVSPDGEVPIRMVGVSACVNLPLQHKVLKFSSGTGSPGWSWKRAIKRLWCGGGGFSYLLWNGIQILKTEYNRNAQLTNSPEGI